MKQREDNYRKVFLEDNHQHKGNSNNFLQNTSSILLFSEWSKYKHTLLEKWVLGFNLEDFENLFSSILELVTACFTKKKIENWWDSNDFATKHFENIKMWTYMCEERTTVLTLVSNL